MLFGHLLVFEFKLFIVKNLPNKSSMFGIELVSKFNFNIYSIHEEHPKHIKLSANGACAHFFVHVYTG